MAGSSFGDFRNPVSKGACDVEIGTWIQANANPKHREIIQWNRDMRCEPFSETTIKSQEILEGYLPKFIPASKTFCYWFDAYDNQMSRI